jgi:replicative DNA helicase
MTQEYRLIGRDKDGKAKAKLPFDTDPSGLNFDDYTWTVEPVTEKPLRRVWVNIGKTIPTGVYYTSQAADKCADTSRTECVEFIEARVTEEDVERLARVLCAAWSDDWESLLDSARDKWRRGARAALEAFVKGEI